MKTYRTSFFSFFMVMLGVITLAGCKPHTKDPAKLPIKAGTGKSHIDPFTGLEVMTETAADRKFTLYQGPTPPKRVTQKMSSFPVPPKDAYERRDYGPLEVLRAHPLGKVSNMGALTVSFNQPMIPLTDLEQEKSQKIPFTVDPKPSGTYKWLGTSVVAFEPDRRFPFATRYVVKIPSGITSAVGGTLAEPKQFTFETPTVLLESKYPYNYNTHVIPETAIVLRFNQRIDPAHIASMTRISQGTLEVPFRLVPQKDWKKVKPYGPRAKEWNAKRTVVLQPLKELRKNTRYEVTLKKGLRSEEGPLLTLKSQSFHFTTYGPLTVRGVGCGWRLGPCTPGYTPRVEFSNSLSVNDKDLGKYIRITPKVKNLELRGYGSSVYLYGEFKAATTYNVSVKKTISDMYEQRLARAWSKKLQILDARADLYMPTHQYGVMELREGKEFEIESINNMKRAIITMVKVDAKDVMHAMSVMREYYWSTGSYSDRHKAWEKYKNPTPKLLEKAPGLPGPATFIPGTRVTFEQKLNRTKNKLEKSRLNLNKVLKGKGGILFVQIYSPDLHHSRWSNPYRYVVLQVTNLGITARYDLDRVVSMVTDLKSGKTLGDVKLHLYKRTKLKGYNNYGVAHIWSGSTTRSGTVEAPGIRKKGVAGPYVLVAQRGTDMAFLPIVSYGHDYGYVSSYDWYTRKLPGKVQLLSHLFSDRNPYRPGERVLITGLLRQRQGEPGEQTVSRVQGENVKIAYTITDPRGQEVQKGETKLDDDGVFTLSFTSKSTAMTGYYYFNGKVKGAPQLKNSRLSMGFRIAAYRAPEHTVTVKTAEGPWFYGKKLTTTITGKYTFGAPMSDARVEWSLRRYRGYFTPPHHAGFSFYINYLARIIKGEYRYPAYSKLVKSGKGRLNEKGELTVAPLLMQGEGIDKLAGPGSFILEATVYDVNRQAIAGRSTTVVHLSDHYLGLKMKSRFVKAGEKGAVEFVAVNLDGKRIPGRKVIVEAFRRTSKQKKVKQGRYFSTQWITEEKKMGSCTGVTTQKPVECKILFTKGGYYNIKAFLMDPAGRRVESHTSIWVHGSKEKDRSKNNKKTITIRSDKSTYKPGDTATLIFTSPFKDAVGLFAVEQGGIVSWKRIQFKGTTHTEKLSITEKNIPGFSVSLALVRGRVRADKKSKEADNGRPKFATGRVSISVSTESKRIKVTVTPSKKVIAPGEKLSVTLRAEDHKGKPVASRLAIMVVDEGVLTLLGYQTPDPLNYFHPYNSGGTALTDIRHWLLKKIKRRPRTRTLSDTRGPSGSKSRMRYKKKNGKKESAAQAPKPVVLAEASADKDVDSKNISGFIATGSAGGSAGLTFKVRKFFATTAYYNPRVMTDAKGEATVTIPMPENLTAFRIMAVAMEQNVKDRYGKGEERVKIRKRFMLRPSLPRFANYGDTFVASVVVNNQTGARGTATVKMDGVGFQLLEKNVKSVQVINGESVEVGFLVKTLRPGRARFRFMGFMGKATDAVTPPPVPVHIPASSEASATYGVTEKAVLQPVKLPKNAMSIFGGLDIHLSSTALTGLQDAVKFIVDYPHECTEQLASRLVPIFSLKKILDEFKLGKLSDRTKRDAIVNSGISRLISTQQWNGGFSYWPGSYRSWPHITAYATWVLMRARANGFKVPDEVLRKASRYLYNFSSRTHKWSYGGWYYAYSTRINALWVLTQMLDLTFIQKYIRNKKTLRTYGKDLFTKRKHVGTFSRAWLMASLYRLEGRSDRVKELGRMVSNSAVETAGAVHFAESTSEDIKLIMHSNSSSDSIVLRALMEVEPASILIPKIVRGLMAARVKGTWETTLSNAWALDALAQYYKQYEKEVPDFMAHIWYGTGFVGSKSFKGRSMDITHKRIPMNFLMKKGDTDFVMAKKGAGKLYYRLGMTYVPKNLKIKPAERGFVVKRTYEPVRDKSSVVRVGPGHWKVKAGSYVRVRLTVVVPDRRYFVAVDDPMPAGFEGVDMTLRTTASSTLSKKSASYSSYWSWYWWRSPDHKDMRDDRYVLYWDRLPAGSYEHSYLVRATTIGTFNVPPLKAVEMYAPEVFGRNGSEVVEIVK